MEFRNDGRRNDQLRPIYIDLGFIESPLGSVLYKQGRTWVLAAMDVIEGVPNHVKGSEQGWLTAEYSLLPPSTRPRTPREARSGRQMGRTVEIQRIIGRAMRSVVDLFAVGENTILLDCDVLQADGGTRTASITAACLAMVQGCHRLMIEEGWARNPLRDLVVGVSVGTLQGEMLLDLNYNEDHMAQVDLNFGITAKGDFVEIQGTGEGRPFPPNELQGLVDLAQKGAQDTLAICRAALEKENISLP